MSITVPELADYLHHELCSPVPAPCRRYRQGTGHYDFYQDHARNIIQQLEPIIGIGNIMDVVRVVMDEVIL